MSTNIPHLYVCLTPSLQRDAKKLAHRRETTLSGLIRSLIEDAVQSLSDEGELQAELAAMRAELDQRKRERAARDV